MHTCIVQGFDCLLEHLNLWVRVLEPVASVRVVTRVTMCTAVVFARMARRRRCAGLPGLAAELGSLADDGGPGSLVSLGSSA